MRTEPVILSDKDHEEIVKFLGGNGTLQKVQRIVAAMRDGLLIASAEELVLADRLPNLAASSAQKVEEARRYQHFLEVFDQLEKSLTADGVTASVKIIPTAPRDIEFKE
jgi:hypothetical protein